MSNLAFPPPIVSLRGLSVTLTGAAGAVEILRGIDLDLSAGETVSVVGPSGAGKTTLLMIIGGLERPSGGQVTAAGHDLAALDEDALARFRGRHVGIVFQSFHLIPTMTALENVAAPRELAGEADAFDRARAELAAVRLDHRLGHYPGELSGGEQQRVAIARALVNRPSLLLADEPTGNLDAATGEQVMSHLFARSRQTGATLVLITHEARLAGLCGRTIRMVDGRIEALRGESEARGVESVAQGRESVARDRESGVSGGESGISGGGAESRSGESGTPGGESEARSGESGASGRESRALRGKSMAAAAAGPAVAQSGRR